MNITRIAVRNITRQKKRSFLLGGAIAFGVLVITLIGSFTRGITYNASANFTNVLGGQLYITGHELTQTGGKVAVIREREVLMEAVAQMKEPIAEKTYRSRIFAEVIFGSKSTTLPIEGVDWADEPGLVASLVFLSGGVTIDRAADAVVIPEYVATELGAEVGETILARTSTVTGQQTVTEFTIEGITAGDSMFSFSSGYTNREYLNGVIGLEPSGYQFLNISLEQPAAADAATAQINDYLRSLGKTEPESDDEEGAMSGMQAQMRNMASLMGGGMLFSSKVEEEERWEGTRFSILNINDMMATVTSMVRVLNAASYAIFLVLLLITMVGLLNTFRMVLIERTQEIGTMRAIGMQRGQVRNIFLAEALYLALGGALVGILLALILSSILGIIPISTESPLQLFLSDNTFAFPVVPPNMFGTLIIITLATLGSAYLPARKAAKLDPAVALRTTY